MRIGEVAERTGISASTLRYYEEIGLIQAPPRSSGQRHYDEGIFDVLDIIRAAKKAGFSLEDIRQVLRERDTDTPLSASWRRIAQRKLAEVEQTIQHYQAIQNTLERGLSCDCTNLHDCQMMP